MRVIGFALLLLGLGGAGVRLLYMNTSGEYNAVIGGLLDRADGTPGASRMEWEDQRATDNFWLVVWGATAVLGVVLIAAAPKSTGDSAGKLRKCPICAELVRREAVKCRFCGSDLPTLTGREEQAVEGSIGHFTGRFNCPGCNAGRPYEGSIEVAGKRYCAACMAAGRVPQR